MKKVMFTPLESGLWFAIGLFPYFTNTGLNTPCEFSNGVYVLQSIKTKRWYTGFTNELRKRFKEHNDNKVFSTKGRGPFKLIYYEVCLNKVVEKDTSYQERSRTP